MPPPSFLWKGTREVLRDNIVVIGLAFVGMVLLFLVGYYTFSDFEQNTAVQGLTETVRVSAMENTDNASRVERGELYLDKEGFEESFKEAIGKNANIREGFTVDIDYRDNENGTTKAIKVVVDDGKEKYQAVVQVDISED